MYTVKQAAEKLGVKKTTINGYILKGYVKTSRVGHIRVISEEEMQRLLDKKALRGGDKRGHSSDTNSK